MNYQYLLLLKKTDKLFGIVFFILTSILFPQIALSQTYSLYVGERKTLPNPTPPSGSITATNYSTDKKDCIGVAGDQIYVHHFFSGTASVVCEYSYSYYNNYTGKTVVDHGTHTYKVTCKATGINLSDSERKIEANGEEFHLTYTTIPKGLKPRIEWKISEKDKNIIGYYQDDSDDGSIYVYGKSEGTAVITAEGNTGLAAPTCKVTVVDNYWVKTDYPSGALKKGTKVTLTLTSSKSGAAIYYTIDGSEPSKQSTPYNSPIEITQDLTLKAKAYLNGKESKTTVREYKVVAHENGEIFSEKTIEGVLVS